MAIMMLYNGPDLTPICPLGLSLHIPISKPLHSTEKELKLRQLEEFLQGHTARKSWSWTLDPRCLGCMSLREG